MTVDDALSGQLLLIDKPLHWTSFQVVNKLRWELKQAFGIKKLKVGHAGTLDPLATGLLVLCTGKMTKEITHFQAQEKTYTGTMVLGSTTPSFDLETPIDEHFPTAHITSERIHTTTTQFIGAIAQRPPVFSAIKKDGKRLYEFARANKPVEIPERTVHISEFQITKIDGVTLDFRVVCSKGTYIRSLAHDFGKALGSGAHLSALRRTRIGELRVEEAVSIPHFITQIKKLDIPT